MPALSVESCGVCKVTTINSIQGIILWRCIYKYVGDMYVCMYVLKRYGNGAILPLPQLYVCKTVVGEKTKKMFLKNVIEEAYHTQDPFNACMYVCMHKKVSLFQRLFSTLLTLLTETTGSVPIREVSLIRGGP